MCRKAKSFSCEENQEYWVTGTQIIIDASKDHYLEWVECPHCHGLFGVDESYLEQVDSIVHCAICCMEVEILEPEN